MRRRRKREPGGGGEGGGVRRRGKYEHLSESNQNLSINFTITVM